MYGTRNTFHTTAENRATLIEYLLTASRMLEEVEGCRLYLITQDPADDTLTRVIEVWATQTDHQASLTLPAVRELISHARPLLTAPPEAEEFVPVGGKGIIE